MFLNTTDYVKNNRGEKSLRRLTMRYLLMIFPCVAVIYSLYVHDFMMTVGGFVLLAILNEIIINQLELSKLKAKENAEKA